MKEHMTNSYKEIIQKQYSQMSHKEKTLVEKVFTKLDKDFGDHLKTCTEIGYYMYMYSENGRDYFKCILHRQYIDNASD